MPCSIAADYQVPPPALLRGALQLQVALPLLLACLAGCSPSASFPLPPPPATTPVGINIEKSTPLQNEIGFGKDLGSRVLTFIVACLLFTINIRLPVVPILICT